MNIVAQEKETIKTIRFWIDFYKERIADNARFASLMRDIKNGVIVTSHYSADEAAQEVADVEGLIRSYQQDLAKKDRELRFELSEAQQGVA